jgi:rare lipoprotein A
MRWVYLTIITTLVVFFAYSDLHFQPNPGASEYRFVQPRIERGRASWYGPRFHGRRMANGEIYDMHTVQAAHKGLPLGSVVEVINLDNRKSILVKITDRGPYIKGRIIDLSYAAARALDMVHRGVVKCIVRRVR